jgi:hypothetical protein
VPHSSISQQTIEKSITVSHNFFNDTHINEHLAGLLGDRSALADGIRRSQEMKSA